MPLTLPRLTLALSLILTLIPVTLSAKSTEWKDIQGNTFRGEPNQVIGPFALFKTSSLLGRLQLLHGLTPEDCQRFYREASEKPARTDSWSTAKSLITKELNGNVLRLDNKKLIPADLSSYVEPEIIVAVYGSYNDGESWQMMHNFAAVHDRIQRIYPGQLATVFFGVRSTGSETRSIATGTNTRWLVIDPLAAPSLELARYAPTQGRLIVAMNRHGVPLLMQSIDTIFDVKKFADSLNNLLWHLSPTNPRKWADLLYFSAATRPLQFASASAPPLLIGNPLTASQLRAHKVSHVSARIAVAADGSVSDVTLLPGCVLPERMGKPIIASFKKFAVFAPAIQNGQPAAGTYDYELSVPPEDATYEADLAWLSRESRVELPINSWLVLKPIRVSEQDFSGVDHVTEDGTYVMKKFTVSNGKVSKASQMGAFNTDFFSAQGPSSVSPAEGDGQLVGDQPLLWKKAKVEDGLVDFQEGQNVDYCIGYAWTEFEVADDIDAWLGLGSDDGVKIWHNGELVDDKWVRRMSRLDDDIVPLHLKKGKNQLLIKIQNATGGWSFIARLRTRER